MRKKVQFLYLYLVTFLRRHKKHLMLGIVIGFLTTLFSFNIYPVYINALKKDHHKIGMVAQVSENNLPELIQSKISLGLTGLSAKQEPIPALAESWDIRNESKEYILNLRKGIYWHDGDELSADDITFRLQGAQFIPIDKYTLKITLEEPFSPLLTILSRPLLKNNFVGLGIYKVIDFESREGIVSEIILDPQGPDLPLITYKFFPNYNEAALAFKLGEIDILEEISTAGEFTNWNNVSIDQKTIFDQYVGVFFNLEKQHFKEKEIRQALAYAISPFDEFDKALTPVSPLSWAYSQKIRIFRHDPEISRKILSESPLSSPSATITISTFTSFLNTAEKIKSAWEDIGLSVRIKVERSLPSDFDVLVIAQEIPPDPDQYLYWQSTQSDTNLTGYSNPKIDKLLEDGRKTIDLEKRKEIYADFQRYLVDDTPVIFLYHPKVYTIKRK